MKTMIVILLIALIIGMASAAPSDDLRYKSPASVVVLSGVDPGCAKQLATENNIEAFTPWIMPFYGHRGSEPVETVQEEGETVNEVLTNFAETDTPLTPSVGNITNATNVTDVSGYLFL